MKRYTDLLLMDKDEVGNKSLGVVKVHIGFQAVELDDTTEGENSAEEKESENRAPQGRSRSGSNRREASPEEDWPGRQEEKAPSIILLPTRRTCFKEETETSKMRRNS